MDKVKLNPLQGFVLGLMRLLGRLPKGFHFAMADFIAWFARRVTPETTAGTTFHFLDAVVGKTFLKGRLAVSVSGNDLLNSGTRFHITGGSDFRYRQWTPSYGRYFLLNLRFRLNKTQSTTRFIGLPPLDVFTGGM